MIRHYDNPVIFFLSSFLSIALSLSLSLYWLWLQSVNRDHIENRLDANRRTNTSNTQHQTLHKKSQFVCDNLNNNFLLHYFVDDDFLHSSCLPMSVYKQQRTCMYLFVVCSLCLLYINVWNRVRSRYVRTVALRNTAIFDFVILTNRQIEKIIAINSPEIGEKFEKRTSKIESVKMTKKKD